ncbi:MAG TPA: archaemetzincin [Planctomycetota bacterium]
MRKKLALALAVGLSALALGLLTRFVAAKPYLRPCRLCVDLPALPPPEPEEGHEKLGPPKPGDWRFSYPEEPQTLEQYAASDVNRRCPHRTTLYIQVLDSRPGRLALKPVCAAAYPKVVERMKEYLEAFFGMPVVLLPPVPIPEEAFVEERDQYDADAVTDRLALKVPADAVAYVGLTTEDLFAPGLNYVFGVGSLGSRAGVYSMRRLQTDDLRLFLERALKLVVHETGHIFSIHHCVTWRCVMQGANSASEQDQQPLRLCPVDLRKLEWNVGGDRAARYERLLRLHRDYGFADADWIEARLKR